MASPSKSAQVSFFPAGGRPASAKTKADGSYQLSTLSPGDGAILGHHQVTIAKLALPLSNEPYAPERDEVPAQYASVQTTPLDATVQANQPNEFNFDLEDVSAAKPQR